MDIAALLGLRGTIHRMERVRSEDGARAPVWREIARAVPCLVECPQEKARAEAGYARAFLPPGTDLRGLDAGPFTDPDAERDPSGDRFTIGRRTWTVRSTRLVTGERAAILVADLAPLDAGQG